MDSTSPNRGCVLESVELRRLVGHEAVNILKCGICWEFYSDPVILACGHTFCFRCLVEMAKHARHNNYRQPIHTVFIGCPNCRRPIYISAILSHKLTHNYPLASLLESLKQRELVAKVTKETNTEPLDPCKPLTNRVDTTDEMRRKKSQYDYDEQKLNLLTTNLDLVLRTLSASGTVLGDLSCAADIQQIVRDFQNDSEKNMDADYDEDCDDDVQDSSVHLCSALDCLNVRAIQEVENSQAHRYPQQTRIPATPTSGTQISVSSLFAESSLPSTPGILRVRPSANIQDPAIVSYALDSQPQQQRPTLNSAEHFPPVGLYKFPGFGRV